MKVGIITYYSGISYGARLQAYALQESVRALGHEPYLIQFPGYGYRPMTVMDILKARSPKGLVSLVNQLKVFRSLKSFDVNYSFTPYYGTETELVKHPPNLDAYITGSDQVWQVRNLGKGQHFGKVYFLNFAEEGARRIAYAPSFGHSFPREHIGEVRSQLERFDFLSVREPDAAQELAVYLNRNVAKVCDPTILLGRSGFDFRLGSQAGGRAAFYFSLAPNISRDRGIIKIFKRRFGNVALAQKPLPLFNLGSNFTGGPIDWIRQVRDATFVLTNSFHATVFSVLYHKPFLFLPWSNPEQNVRVKNLLTKTRMTQFIYEADKDVQAQIDNALTYTDWTRVDAVLEAWRVASRQYLKDALEGGPHD